MDAKWPAFFLVCFLQLCFSFLSYSASSYYHHYSPRSFVLLLLDAFYRSIWHSENLLFYISEQRHTTTPLLWIITGILVIIIIIMHERLEEEKLHL